jgi:hypothetical protein
MQMISIYATIFSKFQHVILKYCITNQPNNVGSFEGYEQSNKNLL